MSHPSLLLSANSRPSSTYAFSSIIISEGEALVRLNHPTVVRFYGFGVDTTYAYIICEFCHGSLDRLLAGALGSWALGYEGRMVVVLNTNPQSVYAFEQNLLFTAPSTIAQ